MGADQGVRHAPPDLTDDIQSLMDSLDEHKVYQIQKGRVLHDDDEPVPDVVAVGLHKLTEGPLNEYNAAFHRLQKRRKMKPVSSKDIPTSESASQTVTASNHIADSDSPATFPNPIASASGTPSHSTSQKLQVVHTDSSWSSDLDKQDAVLETVDQEEEILEDEETINVSEVFQILDNMENGRIEDSLPRTSAEDVAFDMDEIIIEEDDYYTDGTTSESDNDSEGSLEDGVEDFEL